MKGSTTKFFVQGGTAEGLIPKEKMKKFQNSIREGMVYKIDSYMIVKAKEKYRAVDHPFRLSFINTTTLSPINPPPPRFSYARS